MLLKLSLFLALSLSVFGQTTIKTTGATTVKASGATTVKAGTGLAAPTDIAGCVLWLDGSDITQLYTDSGLTTPVAANNDPVGGWKDKSSSAQNFLQATAGLRPLYKTAVKNSKSALSFDGADDQVEKTMSSLTTHTVFIVANCARTGGAGIWGTLLTEAGTKGFWFKTTAANNDFAGDHYNSSEHTTASIATTAWMTFSGTFDGAGNMTLYQNGASYYTGTGAYSSVAYSRVGGHGAENLLGNVAEIVVYNSVLSASDITKVETYLNNKWAIY